VDAALAIRTDLILFLVDALFAIKFVWSKELPLELSLECANVTKDSDSIPPLENVSRS
jgi:hypothetical protein